MIDIMMPFYGHRSMFMDAVRSVLAQTSDEWRLTIVDDCDPGPDVRGWVDRLQHPSVRYVRNTHRLGVSGNFRKCLDLSSASHVVFMGCDDLLLPDFVATLHRVVAKHPGVSVIQPGVLVIDSDGRPARPLADRVKKRLMPRSTDDRSLFGEALATSLLRGNWCYFPAMCWRREDIAGHPFRADMETVLDLDLILDLVLDGKELVLSPSPTFAYRRHAASASSRTARDAARFREERLLHVEVARRCAELGWTSAERAARRHVTSRLHAALQLPAALMSGNHAAASEMLRHATRPLP